MEAVSAVRKLFYGCMAWVAATVSLRYGVAPLALLAIPLALLRRENRALRTGLVCLGLLGGFIWCHGYDALIRAPARALENTACQVRATVEDTPQETALGVSVLVRVQTESGPAPKVLLYADSQYQGLSPGDEVSFFAQFRPSDQVRGERNESAPSRGIFLYAYASGEKLDITRPPRVPVRYWPILWVSALKETIHRIFPADAAPLVQAILTGDKSQLSDGDYGALKRAGLAHTAAVSGLHISFLVGVAVQLLGKNRRRTAALALPVLCFFALAVGCSASVVRAVVMQGLLLLAPLLGRENDPPTSLSAALLLLLLQNPYAVHSISLQLSFAAVAGMFLFTGRIYDFCGERLPLRRRSKGWRGWCERALRFVAASFAASCGALALTTPLAAYYFGYVSLVTPLSNLMCLWAVALVFTGGLTGAVLGMGVLPLGQAAGALLTPLVRFLLWMVRHLADVPFGAVSLTSPYLLAWLVFAYAILLLFCAWRRERRVIVPVCACLCTLCVALLLTQLTDAAPRLTLTALNVGQGQSILLRAGERTALVDCGGNSGNAGDLAADYLRTRGRDRLDLLVLTHFHADHANGVPELLERLQVDVLAVPDVEEEDPLRQEILALARSKGVQICLIEQDGSLRFGTADLRLYAPLGAGEANEEGLSLLCRTGEFSALITGDMGADIEARLVKYGSLPQVDVLVAGHHGAKGSASQLLVDTVVPKTAIVSVGYNSYGHPSPETLLRLDGAGSEIYRTDLQGNITVTVG